MSQASHVAFEVEQAWVDDVERVLAGADPNPVLARWWGVYWRRVDALATNGVRTLAFEKYRPLELKCEALERMNAPPIVLQRMRSERDKWKALLDPKVRLPAEPAPTVESGAPHAFLDLMLRMASAGNDSLAVKALPGAPSPDAPPQPIVEGQVTFAVSPDLEFWSPPDLALANTFRCAFEYVVAESSGPVTWERRGDRAAVSFVWLATEPAGPWNPWSL